MLPLWMIVFGVTFLTIGYGREANHAFLPRISEELDYALLRRWIGDFPHGHLGHEKISAAPIRQERAIGWAAHYGIGILLRNTPAGHLDTRVSISSARVQWFKHFETAERCLYKSIVCVAQLQRKQRHNLRRHALTIFRHEIDETRLLATFMITR